MLRGTITGDPDGEKINSSIDECDILFAVGIKKLEIGSDQTRYASQNIFPGRGHADYIVRCLANPIVYQIGKMHSNDPIIAFALMQMFKKPVSEKVDTYMFNNLSEILGGKEKMDGDCMGS